MGKKKKTVDSNVICFRLEPDQLKTVKDQFTNYPVVGAQSLNQYVRKQYVDILEGRAELVYLNEADRLVDCERYPQPVS